MIFGDESITTRTDYSTRTVAGSHALYRQMMIHVLGAPARAGGRRAWGVGPARLELAGRALILHNAVHRPTCIEDIPNFAHGVKYGVFGCRPAAVNTVKPRLRGSRRGHRGQPVQPPGQLQDKAWTCPEMV